MKRAPSWMSGIVIAAAGGALAVGIVALVVWLRHNIAHTTVRVWRWLGADTALPHWLLIVLCVLAAASVVTACLTMLRGARRSEPRTQVAPIAEAVAWRQALVSLTDSFLDQREKALAGAPVENEWLNSYRDLRSETMDAYTPVAHSFRTWIRGIPPEYLDEYTNEPVWVDPYDGPDETPDGLVEKLWMPLTFPAAIGFWHGWGQRELQTLVSERIDLVDSFIRHLKTPPPEDEVFEISWHYRLTIWTHRFKRWVRRQWPIPGRPPKQKRP